MSIPFDPPITIYNDYLGIEYYQDVRIAQYFMLTTPTSYILDCSQMLSTPVIETSEFILELYQDMQSFEVPLFVFSEAPDYVYYSCGTPVITLTGVNS